MDAEGKRTKSGLLRAVTRTAWDSHRSHPAGRFPAFPERSASCDSEMAKLYLDIMWAALAWAKAGEYAVSLDFSGDLRMADGGCRVVCFGGRGHLSVRARDEETLARAREYVFASAADDGFSTDARRNRIAWMEDGEYSKLKAGSYTPRPSSNIPYSSLGAPCSTAIHGTGGGR